MCVELSKAEPLTEQPYLLGWQQRWPQQEAGNEFSGRTYSTPFLENEIL